MDLIFVVIFWCLPSSVILGFGDACVFLHDRGDYKSGWQLEREWEEEQKRKKNQPGDRRAGRNKGASQSEREKADEETSAGHEKSLFELDTSIANRERFEEKIHRAPLDYAVRPPIEKMDHNRDGDSKCSEEQSCVEEKHFNACSVGEKFLRLRRSRKVGR